MIRLTAEGPRNRVLADGCCVLDRSYAEECASLTGSAPRLTIGPPDDLCR
jgi:hypothetical protein